MFPILFDKAATSFTTNGLGRLSDAVSCYVTEERNGEYELEMEYPMTGAHFDKISHSMIIVAKPFQNGSLQAFRIYNIERYIKGTVKIYARHISYQLSFIPVVRFTATSASAALQGLKDNAVENCPFTFTTDVTRAGTFNVEKPDSIRALLGGQDGSVLDIYHGEYEWDNYKITLHSSRGSNKGVRIIYGKNLVDLTQEETIENTVTGVFGYYKQDNTYSTDSGDSIEEETYVECSPRVLYSDNADNYPFKRSVVKDFTSEFANAPTVEEITAYTRSYITENNIGVPAVNLDIEFVDLYGTPGYEDVKDLQTVNLCDTVTVTFARLGISTESQVIRTVYDVLRERYDSVTIGDPKSNLSSRIADGLEQINGSAITDAMKQTVDRATGVLSKGRRGYLVIGRNGSGYPNELLALDNESITAARHVLRINKDGIGFSSNGYRGPYYQAWTSDGHLTLGGINNSYGTMEVLDENAIPRVWVDKEGLRLLNVKAAGYLVNNVLYYDSDLTTVITPMSGSYYYDRITSNMYRWRNGTYTKVTDTSAGVLAKMTRDGLGVYKGEIDLKWNGERGLYFTSEDDGDELYIGDFKVSTAYGRQTFQSDDDMTGMSGMSTQEGEETRFLYLWAGWHTASNYRFAVNEGGAYTMYGGVAYNIGEWLAKLSGNGTGVAGGVALSTVTLSGAWSGSNPASQVVSIEGATKTSKIDLQPGSSALSVLMAAGTTAIWVENDDGVLTVYCLGTPPSAELTMQCSITTVSS